MFFDGIPKIVREIDKNLGLEIAENFTSWHAVNALLALYIGSPIFQRKSKSVRKCKRR
jgi:hypothetical protein